ncbi:MAG TPA: tetratricopeptide repeat protein [Planctomycetes bacterium]|nr:tetratricopeptide repeat protein [Planctomycetota bacterium]HIK59137.1 tetratricopeptide repeat protein [Planctomycetota bacterium]
MFMAMPKSDSSWVMRLGGVALIALVVVLAYNQALGGGFVYDDKLLVLDNLRLSSLGTAFGAFFEPYWSFDPTATFTNSYWRPLTTITLALGRSMSGTDPLGYHILSLGLHLLASVVAWRLAARLLGSPLLGLGVALLFATHPTHVESVAWISAINDPLYGLFALLALDAFVEWRDKGSQGSPWRAGIWLLPALLSKEQALTLVPVALALDLSRQWLWAPLVGEKKKSDDPAFDMLCAYGPFLLALLVYYVGRVLTFDSILAGFDIVSAGFGLSAGRASQFRIEIMGGFLEHLFLPLNQEVFRQVRPELPAGHMPWVKALGFTGLWLVATSWAALSRRKLELGLLLALPASFLLVLLSYESAGAFPISDRYLYVPALFAALLLAGACSHFLRERQAFGVLVFVAAGCGLRSHVYGANFADDETFFRAAIATSPDNTYVRWGMGNVLLERYQRLQSQEDLDEAAFHFLMSLKLGTDYGEREPVFTEDQTAATKADRLSLLINGTAPSQRQPDNTVMWSLDDRLQANIGQAWCHMFQALNSEDRDLSVAEIIFEQTLKRWPESIQAKLGLGTILLQQGRLSEAETKLREVVAASPGYAEAWHNLGLALADQHNWVDARKCFEQALRFRPDHLPDLINAAKAAIDGGHFDVAQRHLDNARDIHPKSTEPLHFLGMLAAVRGDLPTALTFFDSVLRRQPDHAQAILQRGKVLASQGEAAEAAAALSRACELLPTSFDANYTMASLVLSSEGSAEAALPYLRRAYALGPPDNTRQVLHEALKELLGPDGAEFLGLSRLDSARRDFVHAIDWLDDALKLYEAASGTPAKGMGTMHYERGTYLWAMDRDDEAADAYRTSIAFDPEAFHSYHDLAVIMSRKPGMGAEAARLAAMALARLDSASGISDPGYRKTVRTVLSAITGE